MKICDFDRLFSFDSYLPNLSSSFTKLTAIKSQKPGLSACERMISVDCIMNALEHCKVRLTFFLIHPVYGPLGNRRIPLPACAYIAIRNKFPVLDKENFTGYSDDSDKETCGMVNTSGAGYPKLSWLGRITLNSTEILQNPIISLRYIFKSLPA